MWTTRPPSESADCVFCAMRQPGTGAVIVWKWADALVVMDVAPSAPGQLVVVPRLEAAPVVVGHRDPLAVAASCIPVCAEALRHAGFTEQHVHAVVRWDLDEDHMHPVFTLVPGSGGLQRNELGSLVSREALIRDAAAIGDAFRAILDSPE